MGENEYYDITSLGIGGLLGLKGLGLQLPTSNPLDAFRYKSGTNIKALTNSLAPIDVEQKVGFELALKGFGKSIYDLDITRMSLTDDLNEFRAQTQSGFTLVGNGILKGAITAGTTFLDSTVGLLYGLGLGAINLADEDLNTGFWQGMWDNDFNKAMSSIQEEAENALPNYYTNYEQNAPWYNNVMTANFWGDKVLKNAGFTIGAIGAVYVTGGLGLGAGSLALFIGKGIGGVAKGLGAGMRTLANINKGARKAGQVANYLTRTAISASGEASIEAINAVGDEEKLLNQNIDIRRNELLSQLDPYDPEYNLKAQAIEDAIFEYKESMKSELRDLGNSVYGLNMAILSASNSLEFGHLLSGGFKNSAKLAAHSFTVGGNKATAKEAMQGLLRGELVAINNDVNKGIGRIALATAKNSLSEGMEEASQNLASNTGLMYASARLNQAALKAGKEKPEDATILGSRINPEVTDDLIDYSKAFIKTLSDLFGGFEKPGWEEFFLGALTGSIGTPFIRKKVLKDSNGKPIVDPKTGKEITRFRPAMIGGVWEAMEDINREYDENQALVDAINKKFQDKEFQKRFQHAVSQLDFALQMQEALEKNDIFEFKNSEIGKIVEDVFFFRNAGMIDLYKDIYNSMTSIDDKTLEQIYLASIDGLGKTELSKDEIEKVRKLYENKAKSNLDKINTIQDYYDFVEERFRDRTLEFKEELAYKYVLLYDTRKRIKELEDKKKSPNKLLLGMYKLNDALYSEEEREEIYSARGYINDNTVELSPEEEKDLKQLKKLETLLSRKIKQWEKNPKLVDAMLRMSLFNSIAKKNARDSALILLELKEAKSLPEIELILLRLNILDNDEANQIYQELLLLSDPEVRAKIMLYHYSASSRKKALDWLNEENYFRDRDKAIVNLLLQNVWSSNNLDSLQILSNLRALKENVDNLNADNYDLSELEKYISTEDALYITLDSEGVDIDIDSIDSLSNALDLAIKEVNNGIIEYGNWTVAFLQHQLLQLRQQQRQLNQGLNISNPLNAIDDYINEQESDEFTKLSALLISDLIQKVMNKLNYSDDRKLDKDEIEGIFIAIRKYLNTPKQAWLSSTNAIRKAVAEEIENLLNPLTQLTQDIDALQYIDRINSSNDVDEIDSIYNEAINAGIKESNILPTYTNRIAELKNQLSLHIPGTPNNRYNSYDSLINNIFTQYLTYIGQDANAPTMDYNLQLLEVARLFRAINTVKHNDTYPSLLKPYIDFYLSTEEGKLYITKEISTERPITESLNRGSNEMTTTLTPFKIDNLKNGSLIINDYVGSYYGGIDKALKVQWVIDNKLNELKDLSIHYVINPNYNVMYAAIPYNSIVATKVPLDKGFVIVNLNGDRYLIIGALGYLKGDTIGLEDWQNKKDDLISESEGYQGYYTSAESTKITNIGDGRMVDNLTNQSSTNVVDLIKDSNNLGTNPHNLTIGDLRWGIVYSDGIRTVHDKGLEIHSASPIDVQTDLGKVYIYIPNASGTYYRHEVNPTFYNEMLDGNLKNRLNQAIRDVVENQKVSAVLELKNALVMDEQFYIDFKEDSSIIARYLPRGESMLWLKLSNDKDIAILELLNILSLINPRINVSIESLKIQEEVEDLAEAGALNLKSVKILGTVGANFNIALNPNIKPNSNNGENRKPKTPSRNRTIIYNGSTIEYIGTSFLQNSSPITNLQDIDNLKDIIAIEDEQYNKETILDISGKKPKPIEGQYVFIEDGTNTRIYHISHGSYSRITSSKKLSKLFQLRKDTIEYNELLEAEERILKEQEEEPISVLTSSKDEWGLDEEEDETPQTLIDKNGEEYTVGATSTKDEWGLDEKPEFKYSIGDRFTIGDSIYAEIIGYEDNDSMVKAAGPYIVETTWSDGSKTSRHYLESSLDALTKVEKEKKVEIPLQGSDKTTTFADVLLDNNTSYLDDIYDILESKGIDVDDMTLSLLMEWLDNHNIDYNQANTPEQVETLIEIIKNCR